MVGGAEMDSQCQARAAALRSFLLRSAWAAAAGGELLGSRSPWGFYVCVEHDGVFYLELYVNERVTERVTVLVNDRGGSFPTGRAPE